MADLANAGQLMHKCHYASLKGLPWWWLNNDDFGGNRELSRTL